MLTGRKLLLADDSLTIQKVISLILGDEGVEVVAVGSGTDALKQLAANVPDIVLADVHMPGANGYQVCAYVKRDARLRHVPVLLLVGKFEPFDEAEARRVGADDVVTKPFQSIRDLVSKVGNLLGGGADEKKADEAQAVTTAERAPAVESRAQASEPAESVDASPAFPWARRQAASASEPGAWPPAPEPHAGTFNDFDMDDQTIQTTSAEAFGGHTAPVEAAEPFVMQQIEAEAEPAQVVGEPLPAFDEAPQAAVTAQMQPDSMLELSYAGAPVAASEFTTRAAQSAAADDALLDLGESAPPPTAATAATAEADDFILDLDDEPGVGSHAAEAEAEAPRMLYAEGLANSPAEAAAPLITEDAPQTDARALEADVQAYEQPPQAGQAFELVLPDTAAPEATTETTAEAMSGARDIADEATTWPAADTQWPAAEPQAAPAPVAMWQPAAAEQPTIAEAHTPFAATEIESPAPADGEVQSGAAQLSPETIEAIARRVVELMSDSVVREIAWEVVPDMTERLVRRRLDEERARPQ
ncbi:MAG TPA: response regulator [Pyrinomonadaceae bacterium]|nr:response regulator [Pyrinomonadaceae bacterium]